MNEKNMPSEDSEALEPDSLDTTATNEGAAESLDNGDVRAVDDVLAAEEPVEQRNDQNDTSELAVLRQEAQQAQERALRSQAELDNFRKRSRREMDDARRYACLPLMRDLLPVIDNLQRAVTAAQPTESAQGLLEGVQMVAQQLTATLKQHHCQAIDAAGLPFDPMCHEAVAQQPSNEHPQGTVLEVAQMGYRLHDRVIRPTQVIVSTGTADQASAESG